MRDKNIGISWLQRDLEEKTEVGVGLLQYMRVNVRDWDVRIHFYKSLFQVRYLFIVVKLCC